MAMAPPGSAAPTSNGPVPLLRAQLGVPAPVPAVDPADPAANDSRVAEGLAKYVRDAYETARDFRQQQGIDENLLSALRAVRGQYDDVKKQQIKQMGGSDVYLRMSANKVRAVAAALRDVYASVDRPWGIDSTAEPEMPTDADSEALIQQVMSMEMQQAVLDAKVSGQDITKTLTPQMMFDRRRALRDLFYQHKMQDAQTALRQRENQMDDILQQGGFYQALWDFLLDIPTFPFAVMKGPVVYYKNQLHWEGGKAIVKSEPTMSWERCSPFDVYFAPWSQKAQDGYIVHRQRATRSTLQALLGLPSYNEDGIKEVLDRTPDSFKEWFSYVEDERANLENRDSDNNSAVHLDAVDKPMPMLEFHGPVSGALLTEWGMSKNQVPDSTKDLDITCWLIDDIVIGVRINPHPMGNKPFYVDSFERVPGSIYGLGVPKMIEDVQDTGNACLRALVNNMAIASGPQIGVNEARMATEDTAVTMYPWKVWSFTDDPTGSGSTPPISFFQPTSNAVELLGVLKAMMEFGDTFSSMPQYMQGNAQGMSTIGRTSSGLSMLMDAANRTMKQSVTSIDKNVIEAAITDLNIYLSILRPDLIDDGDINIVAKGATELVNREQLRMKRLNFLQVTQNPIDAAIIGTPGRAAIITEIARDLQLPIDKIVTGGQQASLAPPGASPAGGQTAPPAQGGGSAMNPVPPGPAPAAAPAQDAPAGASEPAAALAAPTQ